MWFNFKKKKNYKYLVTIGCSQTAGQGCKKHEIWAEKLGKKLGVETINLAVPGSGWYMITNALTSFIDKNQDKIDECFFILQTSTLERRVNYQEIPIARTDVYEKYNMRFVSRHSLACLGYLNWNNFPPSHRRPETWNDGDLQSNSMWTSENDCDVDMVFFPEHRHYPNSRNTWKIGGESNITPPYLDEQFEELILHWGREISSYHLFLKKFNIDHIILDGYSPFVSYKLKFRNYYNTKDEYNFTSDFWSNKQLENDEDEIKLYDFKNVRAGKFFDVIDKKYKIDDVILWNLYMFHTDNPDINYDGGHPGPEGHSIIADVIYKNLIEKNWF
jgi:hypothetical protein